MGKMDAATTNRILKTATAGVRLLSEAYADLVDEMPRGGAANRLRKALGSANRFVEALHSALSRVPPVDIVVASSGDEPPRTGRTRAKTDLWPSDDPQ